MGKELVFSSDYIELMTYNYDSIIYTPVYSEKDGLYLSAEDENPIKDITLLNSNLIINYLNGETKLVDISIMSVTVYDNHFKRRTNNSIIGTLFRYSVNDAHKFELDVEKSFDYETIIPKKRKRSL